jgi:hypothetical protein
MNKMAINKKHCKKTNDESNLFEWPGIIKFMFMM